MGARLLLIVGCLSMAAAAGRGTQQHFSAGATQSISVAAGATERVSLDALGNELVQVTVAGPGTLLRVTAVDRDGRVLATRDRRGGNRTPIVWVTVTGTPGPISLVVTSLEHAQPMCDASVRP